MKPVLLFIIYVGTIFCNCGEAETSIITEEKISRLENLLMDVNSRLEIVESKNHALENEKNELKSQLNLLELEKTELNSKLDDINDEVDHLKELTKKLDDINDEVDHLKELTKMLSVRTCDEMHMYGVNKSNYYFIDPDGALNGEEPIRVYCDFTEDYGLTQISHNSEERIEVAHCNDPGCYSRPIIYDSSFDQIKALIELSESCSQLIRYDCFASPLVDEGINYGYWMDKNGKTQIYWTGSNYGQHVCSCHFSEEGCAQEETLHNTCNCDSKGLSELSDVGTITNSSALPITELRFGGLLYDAQAGFHTVGKLICTGKKFEEPKATSCSALKRDGIFKNGYYNVKTDGQFSKLVYCDMTTPGYNDIDEEFIESSESHFVDVENSISDIKVGLQNYIYFPY